jgi:dihydroflavonol-4-reductase
MRVLVTGATGFIGGNLARDLWNQGYEVRALARPGSSKLTTNDTGIERVEGDILDRESLRQAMQGCRAAFHCAAAYTFWSRDPHGVRRANVEGTVNVLECARDSGVDRIVYTSTVSTIGIPKDGTLGDETTEMLPRSLHGHYKQSKFEAEQEALRLAAQGVPVVVVNPTAPVGPWDVKPTPTGKIVLDFLRRRVPAYLATGLNLVDVADVSAGHLLALERGRDGERYILGNRNVTLREMFQMLGRITGLAAPRVRLPYWLVIGAGYAEQAVSAGLLRREPVIPVEGVLASRKPAWVSSQRAITELGLPQSPVERALERAAEWFTAHGYLDHSKEGVRR